MKHEAPGHPKMQDLAERLGMPLYAAIGILEALWHYAGDYAPSGDIGRVTDAAIARAVDWRKRPAALIDALVDTKWLDRDEEYRLIIHDWPDHAQEWIKKNLKRKTADFLPRYERSLYSDRSEDDQNEEIAVRLGKDTKDKKEKRMSDLEPFESEQQRDWFTRFWSKYPRKDAKKTAAASFAKKIKTLEQFERVMAALELAYPGLMAREPEVRPHGSTWLNQDRFMDEPNPPAEPVPHKSKVESLMDSI